MVLNALDAVGSKAVEGSTAGGSGLRPRRQLAVALQHTISVMPGPLPPNIMWFLQVFFIFACFLGLFSVISYLLRHYGSAVKVYLIQTDRVPRSSKDSSWPKAERKRVLGLESIPDELK